MSTPSGRKKGRDSPKDLPNTIVRFLLSRNITVQRVDFANEVNTWLVFVSTKNVSAIDIDPLLDAARLANMQLKAVIDSEKDQLCFFLNSADYESP